MEDIELEALLIDLESDRVERKASDADRDRICEAICAFANDSPNQGLPGVVYVGANDDGSCADLDISDEMLLRLADLRSNGNIYPFPVMAVQKRRLRGCDMVVVVVSPSDSPPLRFRGRTFIRVGPRRGIATPEEERRLTEKRRLGDLPFDLRPVLAASLDDLDVLRFQREYLPMAIHPDITAENIRSIEHQLASLRLATVDGIPTVTGLLVLGKEPRDFMPGAYIQILRVGGTELTAEIKDQKEIGGPLLDVLRQVDELLRINISVALTVPPTATDVPRPDYPLAALQQIIRNAVLHRVYEDSNAPIRINWFSDRVEVYSPGGPFGQVTRANFGQPGLTDYRNPHLAEAMKVLGYVQRFGIGIPTAQQELRNNDNPEAEFVVEDTNVLVVIRGR